MGPYLGISLLKAISAKGFPMNGMVTYYLAITGLVKLMTNKSYCWKVMLIHFSVQSKLRRRTSENQTKATLGTKPRLSHNSIISLLYLGSDGDEHGHLFYNCFFSFCFGIKVSRVSGSGFAINLWKQMVHIIVPIQNPFRSLFRIWIHTSQYDGLLRRLGISSSGPRLGTWGCRE